MKGSAQCYRSRAHKLDAGTLWERETPIIARDDRQRPNILWNEQFKCDDELLELVPAQQGRQRQLMFRDKTRVIEIRWWLIWLAVDRR